MSQNSSSVSVTFNPFSFPELHDIWAISGYEEEHMSILLERENLRQIFHFQSPQIQYRRYLVKWMKEIAANKKLATHSIHLAVYILDLFMDNFNVLSDRLQLIALVSLLLATKYEERATKALVAKDMNEFVNNKFTMAQYYNFEIMILKHLKWNLNFPTIVHFIHIYIEFLYSPDEILDLTKNKSVTILYSQTKEIVLGLMDYVMEDIKLMQSKPSMVAAAIMACTRQIFNFSKIWPTHLMSISNYKLFELKGYTLRLKRAAIFPKQHGCDKL